MAHIKKAPERAPSQPLPSRVQPAQSRIPLYIVAALVAAAVITGCYFIADYLASYQPCVTFFQEQTLYAVLTCVGSVVVLGIAGVSIWMKCRSEKKPVALPKPRAAGGEKVREPSRSSTQGRKASPPKREPLPRPRPSSGLPDTPIAPLAPPKTVEEVERLYARIEADHEAAREREEEAQECRVEIMKQKEATPDLADRRRAELIYKQLNAMARSVGPNLWAAATPSPVAPLAAFMSHLERPGAQSGPPSWHRLLAYVAANYSEKVSRLLEDPAFIADLARGIKFGDSQAKPILGRALVLAAGESGEGVFALLLARFQETYRVGGASTKQAYKECRLDAMEAALKRGFGGRYKEIAAGGRRLSEATRARMLSAAIQGGCTEEARELYELRVEAGLPSPDRAAALALALNHNREEIAQHISAIGGIDSADLGEPLRAVLVRGNPDRVSDYYQLLIGRRGIDPVEVPMEEEPRLKLLYLALFMQNPHMFTRVQLKEWAERQDVPIDELRAIYRPYVEAILTRNPELRRGPQAESFFEGEEVLTMRGGFVGLLYKARWMFDTTILELLEPELLEETRKSKKFFELAYQLLTWEHFIDIFKKLPRDKFVELRSQMAIDVFAAGNEERLKEVLETGNISLKAYDALLVIAYKNGRADLIATLGADRASPRIRQGIALSALINEEEDMAQHFDLEHIRSSAEVQHYFISRGELLPGALNAAKRALLRDSAAQFGQIEIFEQLMQAGGVSEQDKARALGAALRSGQHGMVDFLFERFEFPDAVIVKLAISAMKEGNSNVIEDLRARGLITKPLRGELAGHVTRKRQLEALDALEPMRLSARARATLILKVLKQDDIGVDDRAAVALRLLESGPLADDQVAAVREAIETRAFDNGAALMGALKSEI